ASLASSGMPFDQTPRLVGAFCFQRANLCNLHALAPQNMQGASGFKPLLVFKLLKFKAFLNVKNWHAACDISCGSAVGVIPQSFKKQECHYEYNPEISYCYRHCCCPEPAYGRCCLRRRQSSGAKDRYAYAGR